jgi:hypothetical protein
MADPYTIGSIAKWLSAVGVTAGGLSVFLYSLLKKTLDKTVDSRFDARLERVKHELELESKKQSIVYEQQKESFRKVLVAMHQAVSTMATATRDFRPSTRSTAEEVLAGAGRAFSSVIAEECLFMDAGTDRCLRLFRDIMWDSVGFNDVGTQPASLSTDFAFAVSLDQAYDQMNFISDHLAEHFRARVGLVSSVSDPLLDVDLFGACRLARAKLKGGWFLKQKWGDRNSHAALSVTRVRENPEGMKSDLENLRDKVLAEINGIDPLESDLRSPGLFKTLDDVHWYLGRVQSLCSTAVPERNPRPLQLGLRDSI